MRTGIALLAALLVASSSLAQSVSSGIRGLVLDASGKPAEGATVVILDLATAAERTVVTGEDGAYAFLFVQPGSYEIVARLGDSRSPAGLTVELPLQQTVELDLKLNAFVEGAVATAKRVKIDPTVTATQTRIDRPAIESIPLQGRRFTDLALLDSSSKPAPVGTYFGETSQVLTFNGQGGRSNSFLVDGISNDDATLGTHGQAPFAQLAIQEFQVLTDSYAPEFGRASGGILNVLSRGGGNRFSVEGFLQGTSPGWNAEDPLADEVEGDFDRDSPRRLQGGLAFGGPAVRDQTFYFVGYEQGRDEPVLSYTGLTRDGKMGGIFLPTNDSSNLFVRVDRRLRGGSSIMLRALYGSAHVEGVNVLGKTTPEARHEIDDVDRDLALSWKNLLDARRFNEIRIHLSSSTSWQTANSGRPGTDRPSGTYGGNHLQGQVRDESHVDVVENFSFQVAKHLIKVGGSVEMVNVGEDIRFNPNGLFLYDTDRPFEPGDDGFGGTGAPGVDDDGDTIVDEAPDPTTYAIVYQLIEGQPQVDVSDVRFSLFAQDEWEWNRFMRFTYGLRYDLSTFELGDEYAVPSSIPNGGAPMDMDNVSPRFALAWRPRGTDRCVVRAGAGLFYDKVVLGLPAVAAVTSGQKLRLGFFQALGVPVDEAWIEENGTDPLRPILFDLPFLALYFSTGTVLDTPYARQAHLSVEKALGDSYVIGADLTDARGYHIPLYRDLNPVTGTLQPPAPPLPVHRDPRVGSIAAIETLGNTWYRAFDLSLKKVTGRLRFALSYTWSKSEDEGSDPLLGGVSLPPDSDDIRGEKARSDADRRHRLVLSGGLDLPKRFRITSLIQFSTGVPFNVTSGEDENMDGLQNDRPPGIRRNTGADTGLDDVNAARNDYRARKGLAYEDLPDYTGKLEEPEFFQWDLRFSRSFPVRADQGEWEAFLQVFNVTNRANLGLVDGNILSPGFGDPRAVVGPPRTIEVGAKIRF